MRIWFAIVLISFLAVPIMAKSDLRFDSYGTNEGISVGKVRKVFQDSYGFIWLATEDGLNRYNGLDFEIFRHKPDDSTSISNNKIFDIIEGPDNKLWIATSYGLNTYNLVTGKFEIFKGAKGSDTLMDEEIRSLSSHCSTTIFVGTHAGGLYKIDLNTNILKKINLPDRPEFIRGHTCIDSVLYIGTHGNDFYTYHLQSGVVKHIKISQNINTRYIDQVNDFVKIDSRNIWIGTENGIYNYNLENKKLNDITPKNLFRGVKGAIRVRDFLKDRDGIIWVATNNGLLKYTFYPSMKIQRYIADKNTPNSLMSNWLLGLFEDSAGSIWICNKENGVNLLHNKSVRFQHYSATNQANSLSNNLVTAFDKYSEGQILIGTIGGGLDQFDSYKGSFYNYNKYHPGISKSILTINTSAYNEIWLGTWGDGLQNFNPETGTVKSYTTIPNDNSTISNNSVLSLHRTKNGSLWIATFNGLNFFDIKTKKFTRYTNIPGMSTHTIFYIYSDHPDTLWLGTRGGGLAMFNTKSKTAVRFQHNPEDTTTIGNDVVKFIHKDQSGKLWLATELGLTKFDRDSNRFYNYTKRHGLPNNNIWAILEDHQSNLWVTTNSGLAKVTLGQNNKIRVKNYGKNEGLNSLEFSQGSYLNDFNNSTMYFGGTQGFYSFDPKKIQPRKYNPQVHVTSIKIMNKEFEGDTVAQQKKRLIIPYNRNFLSFDFCALDYAGSENILYKYQMEGQSNKWSQPSTRHYTSFPDLKDGEYVFRVKATNSEGYWSKHEIAVNVIVTPPWWRTKAFYFITILALILSIIGYTRWRTKKLEREKKILEDIVAERTAELSKKNKDITSSIQYAQRIQQAIIFPNIKNFSEEFADSFVLFRPKDIVSGDFFWYTKSGKIRIFAAADCTGHGVPGAFMSIIGNNLLEQIVSEFKITDPAKILSVLNQNVKKSLHQEGRKTDTFDGMDIALCAIEEDSDELIFAGAYNPLILIRNGEIKKYKATRASIGGSQLNRNKNFTNHTVKVSPGDSIYIFSDGMPDQFGGPNNRKFSSKRLQQELLSVQNEKMIAQQLLMEDTIEQWMEGYEQIDDMILVGVRF